MGTQASFSISPWLFLLIPYLHAFLPKVSVIARGRPENAGNEEGAETASTVNVSATTSVSTTAVVSSSSSAAVSHPPSSSEPSPSPTPTSDPPSSSLGSSNVSPSIDPDFPIFLPQPSNGTTCGNATFVWTLADPSFNTQNKQMEVFVTNGDVDQMPSFGNAGSAIPKSTTPATNPTPVFDPDGDGDNDVGSSSDPDSDGADTTRDPQLPRASHIPRTAISLPLSNATAITSGQSTLSALALPQGWYVFAAKSDFTVVANHSSPSKAVPSNVTQTHLIIRSAPFFVADKGNTSCVPPALVQIAQQNQNQSTPTLPLSSGALAGTIVGCIVGVVVLVGACLLPRLWRRGVPGHKAWIGRRKLYHIF